MNINADRVERLANMFAVELLLNDGYLAEHPGTKECRMASLPMEKVYQLVRDMMSG